MKTNFNLQIWCIAVFAASLFFAGCAKEEGLKPKDNEKIVTRGPIGPSGGGGGILKSVYGLTDQNELMNIKPGPPLTVTSTIPLVGLSRGEFMLAIDYRRANGKMYGVSSFNLIYIVNPTSGQVTPVSRAPFEPGLKGNVVGFDVDTRYDQIRIVTDADLNMRLDCNLGTVINVDTDINSPTFNLNSIAYGMDMATRSNPLYGIDMTRGYLVRVDPQNGGVIVPVGALSMVIAGEGGFDIQASGNTTGLAVLFGHSTAPGVLGGDNLTTNAYRLWEIALSSGKTTYKGKLPRAVIGLAIP